MNGRTCKKIRKKALQFFIKKREQHQTLKLRRVYKRMKRLYMSGLAKI